MNTLYPLKFEPILKDKIWGGSQLRTLPGKSHASDKCGESWEISGVEDNISVVSEGFLKGNNLQELIEVYMGDLVGEKIFEKYGLEFPLLIKFIEAKDDLSIQVHPGDAIAMERHNAFGKTEMWYVMDAKEDARLISGFRVKTGREDYLRLLKEEKLPDVLNSEPVKKGDIYFIPAGRVHAIGAGILLAEIQQTSDVTYRIYDYNRPGDDGNPRELHTELALDAIDFSFAESYKTSYQNALNNTVNTVQSEYFTTNLIRFDQPVVKDYMLIDSFVIYICTEGKVEVTSENQASVILRAGETLLVPAMIKQLQLNPAEESVLLEVYVS